MNWKNLQILLNMLCKQVNTGGAINKILRHQKSSFSKDQKDENGTKGI